MNEKSEKEVIFKPGDRVFHKNLQRYGTFVEYDWTGKEECHVKFDTNDGFEDQRHVTTKLLNLAER